MLRVLTVVVLRLVELLIKKCPNLNHILLGLGLKSDEASPTDSLLRSFVHTIGQDRSFEIVFDVNDRYPSHVTDNCLESFRAQFPKIKFLWNHSIDFY